MGQPGDRGAWPVVAGGQLGHAPLPGNVGAPPLPLRLAAVLPHPGPGGQGARTGWSGSFLNFCRLHKANLLHPVPLSAFAFGLITDVGLTH